MYSISDYYKKREKVEMELMTIQEPDYLKQHLHKEKMSKCAELQTRIALLNHILLYNLYNKINNKLTNLT